MKSLLNRIFTLSMLALFFAACSKEGDMIVATSGTPSTVSASASTIVLTKAAENNKALTITITKPDFGYDAVITNTLEIAVKGTNFTDTEEATFDANALTKEFTGAELNSLVLKLGIPTEKATDIEVRIKSSISEQYTPVYSNTLQMKVTPYASTSWLYVPGAYQGWTPATADSIVSPTSNGIYEGLITFTTGNLSFKVLTKKSWGPPEYGKGSTAGSISVGGGDLVAPSAGTFKVTVDLNSNTITFTPYSWGVIGSATLGGWNTDTDMTYNRETKLWSVTTTLIPGAIKFRLNDDWGTNFGGSSGVLASGGSDINVTAAGTYRIDMNLVTGTYTLTKL
ncbi:SusE domain-containing protein [Desertivirga brevis]|uniref:SusE domain-containing protein n=1 Tax=Desertivirga brevis TaxID=2810310 RepID=UPI001A97BDDD|nr:SusE domain-containing protein [Pedobacter sp. SYSU D00873]